MWVAWAENGEAIRVERNLTIPLSHSLVVLGLRGGSRGSVNILRARTLVRRSLVAVQRGRIDWIVDLGVRGYVLVRLCLLSHRERGGKLQHLHTVHSPAQARASWEVWTETGRGAGLSCERVLWVMLSPETLTDVGIGRDDGGPVRVGSVRRCRTLDDIVRGVSRPSPVLPSSLAFPFAPPLHCDGGAVELAVLVAMSSSLGFTLNLSSGAPREVVHVLLVASGAIRGRPDESTVRLA